MPAADSYLVRPNTAYRTSYLEAYDEGLIIGLGAPGKASPHEDFVGHVRSLDNDGQKRFKYHEQTLPCVPSLAWWLVDGSHYIGSVSIRARLDSPLLAYWGGHIAYGVRPSAQGKGYGKRMLALALDICRGMGMPIVRVGCDAKNIASKRVIEANGGIFLREYMADSLLLLYEHILLPEPKYTP